jgi:hypothetical protein
MTKVNSSWVERVPAEHCIGHLNSIFVFDVASGPLGGMSHGA